MTTDTKQPPDAKTLSAHFRRFAAARRAMRGMDEEILRISVRDHEDLSLANGDLVHAACILDTYDEERREWEAQIADLTEGMNSAIAHAVVERKKLNEAEARADRAEKERDAARWAAEMKRSKTNRGFALGEFVDYNGQKCTIQKSSLADADCIWVGVDDANPLIMASDAARLGLPTHGQSTGWVPYHIPKEVLLSTRMHINADMARALVAEMAAIFGDEEWTEVVSGESEKHAWVVANETADERDALGRERDDATARADRAEKERDEACIERDQAHTIRVHALEEKVQMLRERHRIAREVLAGDKVLADFVERT